MNLRPSEKKRIRQIVNEPLPQRVMGDQDGHKLYKFKLLPEALVMPKAVFDSLSPSCYQFSVLPSKAVLRHVGVCSETLQHGVASAPVKIIEPPC